MNLKEAFRFQNRLQSLMEEAQSILAVTPTSPGCRTPICEKRS